MLADLGRWGLMLMLAMVQPVNRDAQASKPDVTFSDIAPAPGRDPTALRALTFNVWGLPAPLVRDGSRFQDIAERLRDFDIVALQEVFSSAARLTFARSGFPFAVLGETGSLPRSLVGNGLAILSRFPIVESDEIRFQSCTGTDCLADKGALFARLQLDERRSLDVYTTHLQSHSESPVAETIRRQQLQRMRELVARHRTGNAELFLGDFNALPNGPAYEDMLAKLEVSDAWAKAPADLTHATTFSPQNTWNSAAAGEHIDYILYRGGDAQRVEVHDIALAMDTPVNGRNLSDHYAVEARLTLTR